MTDPDDRPTAVWTTAALVDRLDRDEESLIMLDAKIVRIAGITPTLLDLCRDGADQATLVEEVCRIFGDPPSGDATALVRDALTALEGEGLLTRGIGPA